ncbi:hypothetical protein [Pseudonocardia sp. D17]|uniref:hypothetical protein n=1 Tax=Pseudonocardia sp. D17 TaxID=882661 RepID=UPI002B376E3E|nr:hypothetical protein PSD17_39100 [Pseudonocardia sp. D17]
MDPLASVEDLRRLTGTSWPDELAALTALRAASSTVRAYCGWSISAVDHEEVTLDGLGGRVLTVPCLHLTAVHEVVDVSADDDWPITDYRWSGMGALYRAAGWPRGFRTVQVTYSGGYEVAPPEVAAVVCGLAGRASIPAGVASMTVGSQTVTWAGTNGPTMNQSEERVLDRYRIVAAS